jgi:O-antigen/teichoic acid export membrane protein
MGLISDAFAKSYGPWMYEKLRDDSVAGRHFIVGVTYYIFFVFLVFSTIASIGIFIIFPYIVGDDFLRAKYLTTFFIFGNGFVGMYYAVAGFFFYSSKTKFVSIVTISSGIISILAMWYFGQWLGLKGVALGYFFSQVILFLLAWFVSSLVYPMPWLQIRYALAAVSSAQSKFKSV